MAALKEIPEKIGKYRYEEFGKLKIPVHTMDIKTNLANVFLEFSMYPEFKLELPPKLSRNGVLRYIVFCYDKNSPVVVEHKNDFNKRKIESALLAGFDIEENGSFQKEVTDMFVGKDNNIIRMIIRYARIMDGGLKYSLLTTGIENYYKNIYLLNEEGSSLSGTAQDKLWEATKKKLEDILELTRELFSGEDMYADYIDLYSQQDKPTMIGGIVEHYATRNK